MLNDKVRDLIVSEEQRAQDQELLPFDIWGTRAHVIMLERCRIISTATARKIAAALEQIEQGWQRGEFKIDPTRGAQLSLEHAIVGLAGEQAGLSTHTARSRNDQVMTAEMLYLREHALEVYAVGCKVLAALVKVAGAHVETVMPGYTHMQPGKPTTFSHWCLTFFDSLTRGLEALKQVITQYDQCPLGAVESFGTSWPIDRDLTAQLLGFSRVWEIPQDAISHRGVFQVCLLSALSQVGFSVSKLATDMMLYSSWEYNLVEIGDAVAQRMNPLTGSSVMPQKRNPDAFELLRSLAPQLGGLQHTAFAVLDHLPSGYNRDSREVKPYAAKGLKLCEQCLRVLEITIPELQPNKARMLKMVCENFSLTTDIADSVAQRCGIPYRQAHKIIGNAVNKLMSSGRTLDELTVDDLRAEAQDLKIELSLSDAVIDDCRCPQLVLSKRKHVGGTNAEVTANMIAKRHEELATYAHWHSSVTARLEAARQRCKAL